MEYGALHQDGWQAGTRQLHNMQVGGTRYMQRSFLRRVHAADLPQILMRDVGLDYYDGLSYNTANYSVDISALDDAHAPSQKNAPLVHSTS